MMAPILRDLQALFPLRKIRKYSTGKLTAPGDNYLSTMLWLDVEFGDNPSKCEHYVAKLLPVNEYIRKLFNSEVTFRNETAFYRHITPELNAITTTETCFAKFITARFSLDDDNHSNEVDQDAVLILENLKLSGYRIMDRMTGFDLPASITVLRTLARFHASAIALRLNNFAKFESLAQQHLTFYNLPNLPVEYEEQIIRLYSDLCQTLIEPNKLEAILHRNMHIMNAGKNRVKPMHSDTFNTIIHMDCWLNNFLIKDDDNGRPINAKLVDFQLYEYGSSARDLMLLLFTSVQQEVLEQNYQLLLDTYLSEFRFVLTDAGCDPKRIDSFTIAELENELNSVAGECELLHCLIMLQPLFADEKFVREAENINENQVPEEMTLSDVHKRKAQFIVKFFLEKHWI